MSDKVIPVENFWAKKSQKHGSGKFHFWKTPKTAKCGGSPGQPTTNRRLKMPYLHCSRCKALLDLESAVSAPQASPAAQA